MSKSCSKQEFKIACYYMGSVAYGIFCEEFLLLLKTVLDLLTETNIAILITGRD